MNVILSQCSQEAGIPKRLRQFGGFFYLLTQGFREFTSQPPAVVQELVWTAEVGRHVQVLHSPVHWSQPVWQPFVGVVFNLEGKLHQGVTHTGTNARIDTCEPPVGWNATQIRVMPRDMA
jgi:hypothetical protein